MTQHTLTFADTATASRPSPEQVFLGWLASCEKPDEVHVGGADGGLIPMSALLGGLALSPKPLPSDAAERLGLPVGTTMGQAATELLVAVNDPAGPRCRSFRAAVEYVRDLHRLNLA